MFVAIFAENETFESSVKKKSWRRRESRRSNKTPHTVKLNGGRDVRDLQRPTERPVPRTSGRRSVRQEVLFKRFKGLGILRGARVSVSPYSYEKIDVDIEPARCVHNDESSAVQSGKVGYKKNRDKVPVESSGGRIDVFRDFVSRGKPLLDNAINLLEHKRCSALPRSKVLP